MKITNIRITVFAMLVTAFFVRCGSASGPSGGYNPWRSVVYAAMLFLMGAGIACFVNRGEGTFPPGSPSWLFKLPPWVFVIGGILIMGLGAAFMRISLRFPP